MLQVERVPVRVRVPVPYEVERKVEVPVQVKVPYPVERTVHVPFRVPVRVPVPQPHPVPVRVPLRVPVPVVCDMSTTFSVIKGQCNPKIKFVSNERALVGA